MVKLLLDNGADVHAHGGVYFNALYEAATFGSTKIAKILLEKGAKIDART
jgi:ankyrin repeat protein